MSDDFLKNLTELELPGDGDLPPAVAEFVLSVRLSDAQRSRYQSLAERHNNGELSSDELKELEGFVELNDVLVVMKAKARQALAKHQPAA